MDTNTENVSLATSEELSRLAAKALGYQVRRRLPSGTLLLDGERGAWDPENSNGDTMELIVGLRLMVDVSDKQVAACMDNGKFIECVRPLDSDPQKSVRHAVLRVAAAYAKGV